MKRAFPAWSPWVYDGGRNNRPRGATLAVVEYDKSASIADVKDRWAPWEHVAHTTWSHADDAKASLRVVVPLDRFVSCREWPHVWRRLLAVDDRIDQQCPDAGRLWFLPVERPNMPRAAWHHQGDPFVVGDIPPDPPRPPPPRGHTSGGGSGRFPLSERYRTDAALRASVGARLGVLSHDGTRASRIPCPGCARPSVWFVVVSPRNPAAMCAHKNTCGWVGWVDQLDRVTS